MPAERPVAQGFTGQNEHLFSISPSIRRYKQLPTEVREEIAKNLSNEALKLLNEGLEKYLEE